MKSISKSFRYLIVSVVLGGLAACTSVTVKTDYDHSASFGKYHT